ncbi:MAG: carboxylate-amine ligase [Gammaproteobacteria bacterium]|nr:carboxylate-amine ligase [Gammaproteobacteria bacterium]
MASEPAFTIGVEEEYLLVDLDTGELVDAAPEGLIEDCDHAFPDQVHPELLQCQIEIGTRPRQQMADVHQDLVDLRSIVGEVASRYGVGVIASSTHPWASWRTQRYSVQERYRLLSEHMQAVMQRMTICGMHVHVGVEPDALRFDLLNQVTYILPHLLALSTSSPFLEGRDTGLKSFRIALYSELPRTGLPEQYDNEADYQREVDVLVETGVIQDASRIWWDIRPSIRYPTLEMRISDVCTLVEDAVCIAAIYRCWLRMLWRLKCNNQRWRRYSNFLISQNRWLAMRYGMERGLIDFGKRALVPYAELLEELLAIIEPDAEHFGCAAEVAHARTIVERGTSADRQRAAYTVAKAAGADEKAALAAVVNGLRAETLAF